MDIKILIVAYIILVTMSLALLIYSTIMRLNNIALIGSVAILGLMNNPYLHVFAIPLEIGVPIILMSLVAICLIICFRLDIFSIPSYTVRISGKLLISVLMCSLLSLLFSDDIFVTLKAIISLAILFFIGWFLFGKIYIKYKNQSRRVVVLISDVVGFLNLLNVILIMMFAGPAVLRGEIGGYESTISFFSVTVPRLQAEGFNATGVGISSGIAILWLFSVYRRMVFRPILSIITFFLIIVSFLCLIWSGSRGAIVALFVTWIILRMLSQINSKNKFLHICGTVLLSGGALYIFLYEFQGILYRGINTDIDISLLDLFYSGRLYILESNANLLSEPSLFGHGFGMLSAGDSVDGRINIESFFLRIWVELGLVGSIVFIVSFIILTIYVVKADKLYYLMGEKGAFFATAIFLFTWTNSITSFGFSLPVGGLAVQLAIAVGSLYSWLNIKNSSLIQKC